MSQNFLATSELFSKGYGFIPKVVMTDTDLTVEAKAIYSYLASYSGAGMSSYPSTELMLKHLNMSMNRYLKHRKILEEKGYLTIKRKKIDNLLSKNIYYLNEYPSRCIQIRDIESRHVESRHIENEYPNSNSLNSNSLNSNSINIKPSNEVEQKETSKESELKERFEAIWKIYPNKKGKRRAYPSYKAAIREGTTDEQIIKGIEAYIEECKKSRTSKDYMMHGSTFFYQRRWEDDYNVGGLEDRSGYDGPTRYDELF